jgi:hypothetical protein
MSNKFKSTPVEKRPGGRLPPPASIQRQELRIQPRGFIKRPVYRDKDKDFEEVMKKLKDISK